MARSVSVPARGRGKEASVRARIASASASPSCARASSVMRITAMSTQPCSSISARPNACAVNRCSHRSMIFSNTGVASDIEWLMTPSTSAAAVWNSSASRVSLNKRTFSIAITAWSAKVRSNCWWCSAQGPCAWRVTAISPTTWPSRISGTYSIAR